MIENRLFPKVEDMLDWTAKRQQMLSANIANIDTPGYRAKDVSFSEEMQSLQLTSTSSGHLDIPGGNSKLETFDTNTKVKDDGNSVDLDHEMTELTKNGLQYVALIQFVSQKLRTLRAAITESGKG